MNKRFSLYLVREIAPLYVAGLSVLLLLLLAATLLGVLADVISRGVSPALVASFLLYSLPGAASYGIPLALLFAALLGITRLGQDSEIKAGLLLGLSPRQFATPLLVLGVGVSTISFINNELLVPWSSQRALEVQKDILLQSPETFLQEGNFFTDALGRSVYIEGLEPGGVANGITVIQSGGAQGPKEVISAERGVLDDAAGVWALSDVRFTSYRRSQVVLDASAEAATLPVRRLAAGGGSRPELTRLPLRDLVERIRNSNRSTLPAEWTALHRKFAEPLAATAFALFALAIGLFTFRNDSNLGVVSVIFLTFVYYATWSVSNLLGAQGTVPAWLAGWAPVALYAGAGTALLALSWRR
ncbi:MAG: LptF/LptG family permease [Trueperaceae bacterium]|nr:LptF/LptG family permease [Trueperaceae bacterium]